MNSLWVFSRRRAGAPTGVREDATLSLPGKPDGHTPQTNERLGWIWGHLRVAERVGAGAFGDLYRAWDDALDSEFALKLFRAESGAVAQTVLREARLLARVRHQNVCRVYGVASHNGQVGIWMEFIHGQTLAEIVDTQGSFSAGEAAIAGVSLCSALAEIHRKLIVHGDIKAQNVMRETGGRLLLTDFGLGSDLAVEPERTPALGGTPAYMAPEVLEGKPATRQSDIYSLGVLLYYLVSGSYPIGGATLDDVRRAHRQGEGRSLRDARPDVPEEFVRVVERAISRDPSQRFATSGQMSFALQALLGKARFPRLLILAIAAAVPLAIYAGWPTAERWLLSPATATLLVADFENRTAHSDLELGVREALTMGLERSRRYYVFPRSRTLETLELMRRRRDAPIDPVTGHEICRREGIPVMIGGEIAPAPDGIEIRVRVTETATGNARAILRASLGGPDDDVVGRVNRLAADVRSQLGEPRLPLAPLPAVTTHSLQALERYARGLDSLYSASPDAGVGWLRSAIEKDPEFATAHRRLAMAYASLGRFEESLNAATRAFELRGRSSELERHLIEGTFHMRRADYVQAKESYKSVTDLYPQDDSAHNQLAQIYLIWADYDASIRELRQAVRLHPRSAAHRGLLALQLAIANREDEALQEIARARHEGVDGPFMRWAEARARLGRGEFQQARETFRSLQNSGDAWESSGRLWGAATLILQGNLASAEYELEQGAFSHLKARHADNEAKARLWLARLYLLQGQKSRALSQLSLLDAQPRSLANIRTMRDAALMLAELGAFDLAREAVRRLDALANEYPSEYTLGIALHARAELKRTLRKLPEACVDVARAREKWGDSLTLWTLARCWEDAQDYGRAAGSYEQLIARKGLTMNQAFPGIWVLAHLGAGRSYRRLGDHAKAAQYYDDFLKYWGHDPLGLSILYEARQERQSLASLGF